MRALLPALAIVLAFAAAPAPSQAADRRVIDARVEVALETLFATVQGARELFDQARGVVVVPEIVKGGLIVGGAYGEGALLINGETAGYYSFAAGSVGLQAGVSSYNQALFFLTGAALEKFRVSKGWSVGAGAEVVFPGEGIGTGLDTKTAEAPVVGVVFGRDGLMAGASVGGGKFTPIVR